MRVNGTEMHQRSFNIYAPAAMPASAMSKVDYFRVTRHPTSVVSNRLMVNGYHRMSNVLAHHLTAIWRYLWDASHDSLRSRSLGLFSS